MSRKYFTFDSDGADRQVLEDATYIIRLVTIRDQFLRWDVWSDAGLEGNFDDHLDAIDYCLSMGAEPFFN